MSFIFEKHEPASLRKNLVGWIQINNEKDYSFSEPPKEINLLNRYLVEYDNASNFINLLIKKLKVYSIIYVPNKSSSLTRVQKLIKEKKIKKEGWTESRDLNGLYVNSRGTFTNEQIDLMRDYYFDSMFIVCKKELSSTEIINLLLDINLFNQPKELGSYYPTDNIISSLIEQDAAIVYIRRDFWENNSLEERDIMVSYSPWKIKA